MYINILKKIKTTSTENIPMVVICQNILGFGEGVAIRGQQEGVLVS